MREIKFRAWDKEKKRFATEDEMRGIGFVRFEKPFESNITTKNWEVMQFTGLLDKNGKEIYEGDWLGGIWEGLYVGWCDKQGGYEVFTPEKECMACLGDANWNEVVEDGKDKKLELIGNIYENPELLSICPECGEPRPGDERVKAGMKCGSCAYGKAAA